jgi:hypothetical protein
MRNQKLDLNDRRPTAPFYMSIYMSMPVRVVSEAGKQIAAFRSPRKLAKAIESGELVLIPGDAVLIGW